MSAQIVRKLFLFSFQSLMSQFRGVGPDYNRFVFHITAFLPCGHSLSTQIVLDEFVVTGKRIVAFHFGQESQFFLQLVFFVAATSHRHLLLAAR